MSDEVTADTAEDQILADAQSGVGSFSDGTNSVSMAPLKDRLEVVDRVKRRQASSAAGFGIGVRQIVPGGTG